MAVTKKTDPEPTEAPNPNPTADPDVTVEEYAEAEKHVDRVLVPSLQADGTPDQTPGYETKLTGDQIPDRVTPAGGLVKGEDVANHPDEKVGAKAADAASTPKSGDKGTK